MMKKHGFLIVLLMILVACSNVENQPEQSVPDNNDVSQVSSDEQDNMEMNESEENVIKDESKPELSFDEQTLVDNEQMLVKVISINPDDMFGYSMNVYLENRLETEMLYFELLNVSVDGVHINSMFYESVNPLKKANSNVSIADYVGEDYIELEYTEIEMTLYVYDTDEWWEAEPIFQEVVHIYPQGQEKATRFVRTSNESDVVIFEDFDFKVTLIDVIEDDWGLELIIYLENESAGTLEFGLRDSYINDFLKPTYEAFPIESQKTHIGSIWWSQDELDDSQITDIEKIELEIYLLSQGTILTDETIVIQP